MLTLPAPQIILTEGEFAGHQAVVLRPAKPFEFLRLEPEIRQRVYRYYFAQKGVVNGAVVLDGKRAANKEIYAKTFADGQKHRVALLAVCKQVSHTFASAP
jgi:hypothetical protein